MNVQCNILCWLRKSEGLTGKTPGRGVGKFCAKLCIV